MFRKLIPCLAGAVLLGAIPVAAQTTLTVSTWVPPQHQINVTMLPQWFKLVDEATEGRVKFRVLPKTAGATAGQVDAVRDGLADVGYTAHAYNPGRFTLQEVAELPLLGETPVESSIAYWRIYKKYLEKFNEHQGVTVLSVMVSEGRLHNMRREIKSLDDMKGLKIRTPGGATIEIANLLGMVPVQKPISEIYELLSTGVVDGAMMPMETVQSFKLLDKLTHTFVLPGGLYNSSYSLFINPDKLAKLSAKDQAALMRVSGDTFSRIWGSVTTEGTKKAEVEAIRVGNKVFHADRAIEQSVRAALGPLEQKWADAAKAKGLTNATEVLAELRAEAAKVKAGM